MLTARSIAIRKARVLARAFASNATTGKSTPEQPHALTKQQQHCDRGRSASGAPPAFYAPAVRCLHSGAAVNQIHGAEDLQGQARAVFDGTEATEEEEPPVEVQHQGERDQEQEDVGQKQHNATSSTEPEFENAVGLAQRVERINFLAKNAANNPNATREALRLLEAGRSAGVDNLAVYKAVLRLLSLSAKAADIITDVSEQMKRDGIAPDLDSYNFIIFGYANSRDVAGAERAYQELVASGLEPNSVTLSNMIVAHSWGNVTDMIRTFDLLESNNFVPTKTAYHSLMSGLRKEENWQGIRNIIHAMVGGGLVPNEAGFALGFLAARRLGDPDFAKMLLEQRSEAGLSPRQDFFVNVMVTLGEAGKSEEVLEFWRQLVCLQGLDGVSIRPETFFLALRHAVKVKAWDEVETIIGMMQDDGKPMDERVHNVLIGRRQDVTGVKDVDRLLSILERMEMQSGTELAPMTQLQLAVRCADAKKYDKAMPLFEAARSAGVGLGKYHRPALLSTLVALGKLTEAKEEWTKATWAHKKDFSGSMLQLFMRVAERLKDADLAMDLHLESFKVRKSHARWFHPTALQILAEAGRLEEAFGIAETLRTRGQPKLPPTSYDVLCQCCKQRGDKEHIIKVVETMRKGNLSLYLPPPSALGFVVEAFTEKGKAREVISLFDRMRAQRLQPDPEVYALLADAAVEANNHDRAAHFLEMARKGGLEPSAAAVAFAEAPAPLQAAEGAT